MNRGSAIRQTWGPVKAPSLQDLKQNYWCILSLSFLLCQTGMATAPSLQATVKIN